MKLKRAVITEELVTLTGGMMKGVILKQFIYWATRTRDAKEYLEEIAQKERFNEAENQPATEALKEHEHGWIYKKAEELGEEIMADIGRKAIRRIINELRDNDWIKERKNPKYKWDQTLQYWVNLPKIEKDLQAIGYTLATVMGEDFPLVKDYIAMVTVFIGKDTGKHSRGQYVHSSGQDVHSSGQDVHSSGQDVHSKGQDVHAIPETTTRDYSPKITTKDHSHSPDAREMKNKNFSEKEDIDKKKSKTGGRLTAISSILDNHNGSNEGECSDFSLSREFSQFKADLIEYAKATGKRSPNGWVNTILREVKELEGDSPFYQEWLDGKPLGSHLMNPWDIAAHKPDPKFKQYLKNELAEPHDSEAKKIERMNYVLCNPDRAQEHWESYQRKIEAQKEEEEKKAQEEIEKMDEIFPEDAPYQFVEMMVNQEEFSKSFNAPKSAGSGFLRSGILKAYSHADHKEKDAIAQLLLNNEATKNWASKTLDYDKIVSNS